MLVFVVVSIFPGQIAPYDPTAKKFPPALGPSWQHLLGTTTYGEDIFSQLVWGTRGSLVIALAVGALATVLAVLVGVSAGYLGGATDGFLSLVTDVILVLPIFPLIIVIAAYEKNAGFLTLVVVLGVLGWSYGARQLRSQTLSLRRRDFLESARVRGERKSYVILCEILPTMTSLIVATFLGAALYAVLTAAGLQFIGLGDPNSQSWGTMLYWAQNNEALFAGMPLWAIAPGVCIALLGASFALLNYAFDEISSPALRVRKLERARFPKAEPPPPEPMDAADQHVLKVEDLTVAYATDSGPVVAVDHVDFELGPRRVPRDRRRVWLREVDAALRDRAAARRAATGRDRRRPRSLPGPRPGPARGARAAPPPLARPLGRDAERDERAQPRADRRRSDARCLRGPLEHVQEGDPRTARARCCGSSPSTPSICTAIRTSSRAGCGSAR